jgi:hypothetical protein
MALGVGRSEVWAVGKKTELIECKERSLGIAGNDENFLGRGTGATDQFKAALGKILKSKSKGPAGLGTNDSRNDAIDRWQ